MLRLCGEIKIIKNIKSINYPCWRSFCPKRKVCKYAAASTLRSSDSAPQNSFLILASWARVLPTSACRAVCRSADAFISEVRRFPDSWRARRIPSSEKCWILLMFCWSSSMSSSAAFNYAHAIRTNDHSITYKILSTQQPACLYLYNLQLHCLTASDLAAELSRLSSCISTLQNWFCHNGLALNSSKSDSILFRTRQRLQLSHC